MTAFASNLIAALPGVGVKQDAGGVGAIAAGGATGGLASGFEAMLGSLMGEGAEIASAVQPGSAPIVPPTESADGQSAAETLLAGAALPFAALVQPLQMTMAKSEADAAPAAVVASAVDAAIDAALPAPVELALDIAATVVADAVTPAAAKTAATVAPTVDGETPRAAAAQPAAENLFVARTDLPSLGGEKTPVDPAAAPLVSKAAAPVAYVASPIPAAAPQAADAAVAAAAMSPTPQQEAAAQAVGRSQPQSLAQTILQAAGAVVSKIAKADAPAQTQAASAQEPDAAPSADDAAVAVTASAIAEAAAEPARAAAAPAVAAAMAPIAAKPVVTPPESRRAARAADVLASLETDPAAARADKIAAKVADAQISPVEAAADAAPETALAPVDVAEAQAAAPSVSDGQTAEPAVSSAPAHHADATPVVRGSPETVAKLAADIAHKLNGQNTKFDIQLDPFGLGKVDVSVEINADGRLTAALSFDSAAAAADLKGRSAELRQALQQAGFEVSDSGLSFDMAGQNPGFGGREANDQPGSWSNRAFQTAKAGLDDADARLTAALSNRSRTPSGGVDIRI